MEIGKEILKLRKKHNFSQEELAEKMEVTRQTISKWELGETAPDIKQAKKLSKIFNISLDELVANDINNILIHQGKDIKNSMNKTAKNIKIIIITIYLIILITLIFVTIHFLTKRDFTTEYQTEFRCIRDDEDYSFSATFEFSKLYEVENEEDDNYYNINYNYNNLHRIYYYYIYSYDNNNQFLDRLGVAYSLNDAYESLMVLKKVYIDNGFTCK